MSECHDKDPTAPRGQEILGSGSWGLHPSLLRMGTTDPRGGPPPFVGMVPPIGDAAETGGLTPPKGMTPFRHRAGRRAQVTPPRYEPRRATARRGSTLSWSGVSAAPMRRASS